MVNIMYSIASISKVNKTEIIIATIIAKRNRIITLRRPSEASGILGSFILL